MEIFKFQINIQKVCCAPNVVCELENGVDIHELRYQSFRHYLPDGNIARPSSSSRLLNPLPILARFIVSFSTV